MATHAAPVPSLNRTTAIATTHCLLGCGIGEVLGFVIATALGWGNVGSIALAVALAFPFGYAFTLWPLLRAGLTVVSALGLVVVADTIAIAIMEAVDNAIVVAIPGALDAGLSDFLFWWSLAAGLAVAWIVVFPVNRWLIGRGLGHALAHKHMGHH